MPDARNVISNTTPLLYLHRIGQIEILPRLYGRICVAQQVVDELDAGGENAPKLRALDWVDIREALIPESLKPVADLGAGEAGTIALGLAMPGAILLLLDDRFARQVATFHRLQFSGTAGVLLRAKEAGLIEAVRPLLQGLVAAGFYLRSRHLTAICRMAGE